MRSLEERGRLTEKLMRQARGRQNSTGAAYFRERRDELRRDAELIRKMITEENE